MKQAGMFVSGEDSPLLSGVPERAQESIPQYPTVSHTQHGMFRCSVCRDTKMFEGRRCMYCEGQHVPEEVAQQEAETSTIVVHHDDNGMLTPLRVPPGLMLVVYEENLGDNRIYRYQGIHDDMPEDAADYVEMPGPIGDIDGMEDDDAAAAE